MKLLDSSIGFSVGFCLLAACTASAPGDSLSDSNARALVEQLLAASEIRIKLGQISVVRGPSTDPTIVSPDQFEALRAWEKVGVVSIERDKAFSDFKSGKTFSWEQVGRFSKTVDGVVVAKTTKGQQAAAQTLQEDGWLILKQGTFRVSQIVKNEAFWHSAGPIG
jgi:hypothetical protein